MRRERSALRGCSRRCAEPGSLSGDGPGERGWRWSSASGPAPEDRGCSQLCLRNFGNCLQQFFALPSRRGSSSDTCQTGKVLPGRETAPGEETKKRSNRTLPRESKDGRTAGKSSQERRFYSISAALPPLHEPFAAPGRRERGRLGCARLGTGTNSSLPCSGRCSGPVRDSPSGCKGARATSELVSRDKGAKRVRRDPSLRGKGVGRVSLPGPACGGASPPAGAQQPAAALKPGPCALSGTKARARALGDA
ncbi:uncharacterized protein LOC113982145 isoform X5 [Pipra filicauda]|uniref:Uncharacterized protein LOC113982145 isoform X5 n=1 Tax=Pipra filicauda TaxID=649802 RepID=A0A7R5KY72_9PASS|nr:uncharacterized protein LOC113982145 isoform X5 [Pipra filicauda]